MVGSIAATSFLGQIPLCGGNTCNDFYVNRRSQIPCIDLRRRRVTFAPILLRKRAVQCKEASSIKAFDFGITKEAYLYTEKNKKPLHFDHGIDKKTGFWPPENKADNFMIHNPLVRQERMGSGWLGVIFEWEGVIVEDNLDLEIQSWLTLSEEEGKSPPPTFILKRIEGMKNEQAISEVLCWSRDPKETKRISIRREEIYQSLQGGVYRLRPGSEDFINLLQNYNIPMALVSTRPRKSIEKAIMKVGVENYFHVVVSAEDVYRGKPDPEMFVYAGQSMGFVPERIIVFGNSNGSVEAAHDARMKCVAVASKHPVYELGAADLVVRCLNELSMVDLKNLAAVESAEFGVEPEFEMEEEEEDVPAATTVAFDDDFW